MNADDLAYLQMLADRMLNCAQTLRVQQVQACNQGKWGEHYIKVSDLAWHFLNLHHRLLTEKLGAVRATPGTP